MVTWRKPWAPVVLGLVLVTASCGEEVSQSGPATAEDVAASTTSPPTKVPMTTAPATTSSISSPAPASEGPSAESSVPTTVAVPTTAASTPTSTVAVATGGSEDLPRWSTPCVERLGDASAAAAFDPQLTAFTTLGDAPTLDLRLPIVETSPDQAGWSDPAARTSVVPGGVIVGTYPPSGWPTPDRITSSSLVAVDHDGTLRWRRCFDDVESRGFGVAPAALEPTTAWVISEASQHPLQILGVDLRTGSEVAFPIDVADQQVMGSSDRYLLLGLRRDAEQIAPDDELTLVDLFDAGTSSIPYPSAMVGRPASDPWFELHDPDPLDDDVVVSMSDWSAGSSRSLFVDGAWRDDGATLRAVVPPRVTVTFEEPFELQFIDGADDLVWSVPDFRGPSREGFHWAVADEVVLAMRCLEWDEEGWCRWTDDGPPAEELVGFDRATGEALWTLPGPRAVPVLDGNRAIVTHAVDLDDAAAVGYVLIDVRTGARPETSSEPGAAWPAGAFAEECCGGDEFVHVDQHGAVVIATNSANVRVWYPPQATVETTVVDLTE